MRHRRTLATLVAGLVAVPAVAFAQAPATPAPAAKPAQAAKPASAAKPAPAVERGRYLAQIMDCHGCHTGGSLMGKPDPARHLAGSEVGFEMPGMGVIYPKNLTPDPDTGLGKWTDAEILAAVRQGKGKDGRTLAPVMPWPSYAALTSADAAALVAYLRSVKPVRYEVPKDVKNPAEATAPYMTVAMPKKP